MHKPIHFQRMPFLPHKMISYATGYSKIRFIPKSGFRTMPYIILQFALFPFPPMTFVPSLK